MNTGKRTLFLHVGTQKTGSSYIQHMLRRHAVRMQHNGVDYRHFSDDLVTSGNGDRLIGAVRSDQDQARFQETVDGYFGDAQTAIVSSELLYTTGLHPEAPGWHYLLGRFAQTGIRLELIAFFRNPVDYVKSAYSQDVKRHGCTDDFADYVSRFSADVYDGPLRQIVSGMEFAGADTHLHAIDYDDAVRCGLWNVFLALCRLSVTDYPPDDVRINPSLNARQLQLHRIYNAIAAADGSNDFADLLLNHGILADSAPLGVTEADYRKIEAKFAPAVAFVNRHVRGHPVQLSPPAAFSAQIDSSVMMNAPEIVQLVRALSGEETRRRNLEKDLAHIARWGTGADPDMKRRYPGFDPLAYLVCNPDLVVAQVDPYEHFESFGRHEGRKFRFGD